MYTYVMGYMRDVAYMPPSFVPQPFTCHASLIMDTSKRVSLRKYKSWARCVPGPQRETECGASQEVLTMLCRSYVKTRRAVGRGT